MRVPNESAPLVSIPGGGPNSVGNRRYGLNLNIPMEAANATAAAHGGASWLKPVADGFSDVARATSGIMQKVLQQRAETDANNAYSALTEEANAFLYSQDGVFSRQGTRAANSVSDTRDFYEKAAARHGKGLNDAAARMFTARADQSRMSAQHSVAIHEGRQLQVAQFEAVKSGMAADHNAALLGYNNDRLYNDSLNQVRAGAERLAQLNGWDAATTAQFVQKATTDTQIGRMQRFADAGDFERAFDVWKQTDMSADARFKSGAGLEEAYFKALMQEAKTNPQGMLGVMKDKGWTGTSAPSASSAPGGKPTGGRAQGLSGPNGVPSFVARFESGKAGSSAIGYDSNGGTSYGTFQLSGKAGTMNDFIGWLEKRGSTEAAAALREAGPADTGSKSGAMPEAWQKLVVEGKITDEMQTAFINETHVAPAMKGQSADFAAAVEADESLAAAVYSTAVQHGPGGARKLLAKAWADGGGDPDQAIRALYEARKGQFPSSTPEVRQAVAARLDRERDELLAARQGKAGAAAGAQAPEQAPDQARGQTSGQTEPGASPASGKPGYEKNPDPQSIDDLISPAGRNVLINTAQDEAQKQQKAAQEVAVNQVYNSIREQTKGMNKEQAFAFFSEVTADAPPELQAELFKKYKADEAVFDGMQLRQDRQRAEQFKELVRNQNILPSQAGALIDQIPDLSDAGKERLKKHYAGEQQKEDPRNRELSGKLFELIDTGAINSNTDIQDYAYRYSLTDRQLKLAETYLNEGGNAGRLSYSKVKTIYSQQTKGGNLDKNPEFFEAVKKTLTPGKAPDEAHVRKTVANLLLEGETAGSGWYMGAGKDETYYDAVKKGTGDKWLPDVTRDEEKEIAEILKSHGVNPTPEAVRLYKKHEIQGIPRR